MNYEGPKGDLESSESANEETFDVEKLPESLKLYIESFDPTKAESISLNQPNLNEENFELFLRVLLKKYDEAESIKGSLNHLVKVEFNGTENLKEEQSQMLDFLYMQAFMNTVDEVFESKNVPANPDKTYETRVYEAKLKILRNIHLNRNSGDEKRGKLIDTATRAYLQDAFRYTSGLVSASLYSEDIIARAQPSVGGEGGPEILQVFNEEKQRYLLQLAVDNINNLDKKLKQGQTPLSYLIQYAGFQKWTLGQGLEFKREFLTPPEIRQAFYDWAWPRIQHEAIKELSDKFGVEFDPNDLTYTAKEFELPENAREVDFTPSEKAFDFKDPEKRKAFFNQVYGAHYNKNIKDQRVGALKFMPPSYSSLVYHKDIFEAGLDYLAQGFFQSPLNVLEIDTNRPNGRPDQVLFDLNDFLIPLEKHTKEGKPLPFAKIDIKHIYEAKDLFQRTVEIATNISDHPGDYHKLSLMEIAGSQDHPQTLENLDEFEHFIDQMTELAAREDKPLSTDFQLTTVFSFYDQQCRAMKVDLDHAPEDLALKEKYDKLKGVMDKLENLQRLVAVNRRKINFSILKDGEQVVGSMTEFAPEEQQTKLATNIKDIRACKRDVNLESALSGVGLEMEQEEEEQQEKAQEKAQEKEQAKEEEQEQEMEQAHGDPGNAIRNVDEFISYAKTEFQGFYNKEDMLKQMWHNIMGSTLLNDGQVRINPNQETMSKEVAFQMLKDPESFQFGFSLEHMPEGICYGLVNTEDGPKRGFYYDISKEYELNPLTAQVRDPVTERPRRNVGASHFMVKERPTKDNLKNKIIDKATEKYFEPLTREEINSYNNGNLSSEVDFLVTAKMLYTTSTISPFDFLAWVKTDSISKAIIENKSPQEIAEVAANFGGDALFQLTKKLHAVKDRCKDQGAKKLFEPFLNNVVLQLENEGWGSVNKFGDHMMQHKQYKTLDKIAKLEGADLKWFMSFCNEHAKHHANVDLERLYDSFEYFKNKYKQVTGNQPLPTENIEAFAKGCTNMRVGLDRVLAIVENAKENNLLNEQLEVLTQLDLHSNTTIQAIRQHGYRIVLPEMGINQESIKQAPITSLNTMGEEQSIALAKNWLESEPLQNCKQLFARSFGLRQNPSYEQFKVVQDFIDNLSIKDCENPQQTKAFMYTFAGFCLFHENGLKDIANEESLQMLAKLTNGIDFTDPTQSSEFTNFFKDLAKTQEIYNTNPKGVNPPTIESLSVYVETMKRLDASACFKNKEGTKIPLDQAFNASAFYRQAKSLFEPILKLSNKTQDKLSDQQLAIVLTQLQTTAEDNEIFAKLQGQLLNALCLTKPNTDLAKDENTANSLAALLKTITDTYCQDEEALKNVSQTLMALQGVEFESLGENSPSFEQLQAILEKASLEPQPDLKARANWILQQEGFKDLTIDVNALMGPGVNGASFSDIFAQEKSKIIEIVKGIDINVDLNAEEIENFEALIDKIIQANLQTNHLDYAGKLIPKLKSFIYDANNAAIQYQQDTHLKKLSKPFREEVANTFNEQYPMAIETPTSLNEIKLLSEQCQRHHSKMETFYKHISALQSSDNSRAVKQILSKPFGKIPLEQFNTLLIHCAHCETQTQIYPHQALNTLLRFSPLEALSTHWANINQLMSEDILINNSISQEAITQLVCDLAGQNKLNTGQIHELIGIDAKNHELYEAIVKVTTTKVQAKQDINLKTITDSVNLLLENGIDAKALTQFIKKTNAPELLEALSKIDSKPQLESILKVLQQSAANAHQPTAQDMLSCLNDLKRLDVEDLHKLAGMDLDAPYPNLTNLQTGLGRINSDPTFSIDNYFEELQRAFFRKKNDPDLLKMLFNDGRVVDVINDSNSLAFKQARGLPQQEKEALLSDYAYMHAIGLDQPVYHDKAIKDLTKPELKSFMKELREVISSEESTKEQKHLAELKMLACAREVYFRADGKFPYSTQMISTLMALRNGNMNINEIATGQGKSLTAAMYATVMWARKQPVVVCTSNLTLASEGLEENQAFYDYMGIPTQLIRAQSNGEDFQQDGINYTDVSNMALYLAKTDIQGSLKMDKPGLILDEVDFTVLDEVTDYRYAVNLSGDGLSSDVNFDEWLYYQINKFVDSEAFLGNEVTRESDVINVIKFLQKQFVEACKPGDEGLKYPPGEGKLKDPIKSHIQQRLMDFQNPYSEERKLLDTWIDSAHSAKVIFQEGHGKAWILDTYMKDGQEYSAARIISHHRVAKGSKWSKGVHQFVHARINTANHNPEHRPEWMLEQIPPCKIDSEKAHVAALSSKNFVDYFIRRGGSIWGMTGTVGSAKERAELAKKYGFKLNQVEPHQKRTAKVVDPVFAGNAKGHVNAIYSQIKKYAIKSNKMPTVIVEEDAKTAQEFKDRFFKKLKSEANSTNEPPRLQFYNGIDYELYEYNPESRKYEALEAIEVLNPETNRLESIRLDSFGSVEEKEDFIKKQAGTYNTISITTPMMGRGTDFKPKAKDGKSDHPDGLFVIGAYVEASEREERQIIGRMGRQGKPGLYVNVVDKSRFIKKLEEEGIQVPFTVKHFNPSKLSGKFTAFKRSKNMSLAKERQMKQTFGDIRSQFYLKFTGLLNTIQSEEGFNEIKEILKNVDGFDEAKFKGEFTQQLMRQWNRFLIRIDKEYIRLRDEKDGNYDEIFKDLQDFCYNQWNNEVISNIQNNFGFKQNSAHTARSDIFFSDFRDFREEDLENFAQIQAQKEVLIEAKKTNMDNLDANLFEAKQNVNTEDYQEMFSLVNFEAVMKDIINSGKEAMINDPVMTIHNRMVKPIINYKKHFFIQEPEKLANSEQPENDIAQVLAIDLLNEIASLNQVINKDKRIILDNLSAFALLELPEKDMHSPEGQRMLFEAIRKDPQWAHEVLLEGLMAHNLTLQNQCKEKGISSKEYVKQYAQVAANQHKVLARFKPHQEEVVDKLIEELYTHVHESKKLSVSQVSTKVRESKPEEALHHQLSNKNIKFEAYDLRTLKQDIKNDIRKYLNDKSKFSSRKKQAKALMQKIDSLDSAQDILKALSDARLDAMNTDINKTSFFRTRNVKGSRFQDMLNRSVERFIVQGQDQISLLTCANQVRKDIAGQLEFLAQSMGKDKDLFDVHLKQLGWTKDGNFEDKPLTSLMGMLNLRKAVIETYQKDKKTSKAVKASLNLLDQNLKVLENLSKKMDHIDMDLGDMSIMLSDTPENMVKSLGMETVTDALRAIEFLNPDILSIETSEEVKRKVFNQPDTMTLPESLLGEQAKSFINNAKENYHHETKPWGPPLTQDCAKELYAQFEEIDKDVTSKPDWAEYWREKMDELVPPMEKIKAQEQIQQMQAQVLSAYRFNMIAKTNFLVQGTNESQEAYKLREARCRNFVQQISRLYMANPDSPDVTVLHDSYKQKLQQEINKSVKHYETLLRKGKPIRDVIPMMKERIDRLTNSHLVEYLGDEGKEILKALKDKQEVYNNFKNELDKNLNEIATKFVPGNQHNVHDRVIDLIDIAVNKIKVSEAYEKMGSDGLMALKSHLSSKESIQRVYQMALEARTKAFMQKLPNEMDILVDNSEEGLHWIRYPRSRREVIHNLSQIILSDKEKYPDTMQNQAMKDYQKMQELYMMAVSEDLQFMPRDQAQALVRRLEEDPMLQPCPLLSKSDKKDYKERIKEKLEHWHEVAERRPKLFTVPKVFSEQAHTGIDISVGLLQKLEETLKEDNRKRQENLQEIVEEPNEEVVQTYEEFEVELKKNEREIYTESQDYTLVDLKDMLFDEKNHFAIKGALKDITDLDERASKIQALFEEAIKGIEDCEMSGKYNLDFKENYLDNQKKAIKLLQGMYLETLKAQAIELANEYADIPGSDVLPHALSEEAKNEIYMEVIAPGREKEIMQIPLNPEHTEKVHNELDEFVKQIDQLPELEENQTHKRSMRTR